MAAIDDAVLTAKISMIVSLLVAILAAGSAAVADARDHGADEPHRRSLKSCAPVTSAIA
jgi:hypothetical protein